MLRLKHGVIVLQNVIPPVSCLVEIFVVLPNLRIAGLGTKIGRGLFPTWFFFATMEAIGSEVFRLRDLR